MGLPGDLPIHKDSGKIIGGKYKLQELAGEGGMATVWKGEMQGAAGFSRTVAIKKMKPEFLSLRNYIDMFVEEARVGASMQHPNIVQVLDFLQDKQRNYYLILEWVQGIDVHQLVSTFRRANHRLPWGIVAAIGIGCLRGLAAAHERVDADGNSLPVIHRDVSPQNILLSTGGAVKLTDFGLALAKDRIAMMTMPGTVKGKLSYLSPEGVRGHKATALSDIFAMGTVLWEALAGRRLFDGEDDGEVFLKVRNANVPSLLDERPGLPEKVAEVVHRALAVDPNDRFVDARSFALELSILLGGAQNAQGAQQLLGKAVNEVRRFTGEEKVVAQQVAVSPAQEPTRSQEITKDSWEAADIEFSTIAALKPVVEDLDSVDIWFSDPSIELPPE